MGVGCGWLGSFILAEASCRLQWRLFAWVGESSFVSVSLVGCWTSVISQEQIVLERVRCVSGGPTLAQGYICECQGCFAG